MLRLVASVVLVAGAVAPSMSPFRAVPATSTDPTAGLAELVARRQAEWDAIQIRRWQTAERASRSGGQRDTSGVWAALRECENSGNYRSAPGDFYRGAYQFDRGTWASVGGTGDPAAAPPAEQDARARALQARSGWLQWPRCARKLGLA